MKNLNFNQKIGLGLFLMAISFVFKHLSPDHSIAAIAFSQGFFLSMGFVFLIVGSIQKRKAHK